MTPHVQIVRREDRFQTQLPWLESRHSFSFGGHYDPQHTHHGLLLVSNDDIVKAGTGFQTHPHRDMEIVTWVLDGELEHKDSEGHRGGMDGLAVVAALEPEERPAIVFVTAHGEYAIRAFDVHAVDYLLKPFDAERFATALRRARARMAAGKVDRLEALLATLRPAPAYPERLLLKHEGTVVVVPAHDIDWVEAADNYVKIHARTGRYMVREPLKQIEAKLDPARFARAHRSAIVNLSRVKSLDPLTAGENIITLTTGTRLTLSRGYRDHFKSRLESAGR